MTESVSQLPIKRPEMTHEELLATVMAELRIISANVNICLRGLQTLLIEKAAEQQVNAALEEVTQALEVIETRDTLVPNELPTNPANERPE